MTINVSEILNRVPTKEELAELHEQYPFWINPDVSMLKGGSADQALQKELSQRIGALVGDRDTLITLLGEESVSDDDFYPDRREAELSTDDTIDSFIDKFGGGQRHMTDAETLEKMWSTPTIDYAAELEKEPESVVVEATEKAESKEENHEPLTEEMALDMIKTGCYTRALEIIVALNLNNPKKSVYFADQIRFLKKLIINDKKTNQ
jgi:hypothetical protein